MSYLTQQKKTGFQKGDRVRVLRRAASFEKGWNNNWCKEMDGIVGAIRTIVAIDDEGIILKYANTEYWFPYFVLEKVEEKMNIKQAYKLMQDNSGLKVGDRVKVLRKAQNGEMGWDDTWSDEMDHLVGQDCIVDNISGSNIYVYYFGDEWAYVVPFFILEKIEVPLMLGDFKVEEYKGGIIVDGKKFTDSQVKLLYDLMFSTGEYGITKDSYGVQVGCCEISPEQIETIYDLRFKKKK